MLTKQIKVIVHWHCPFSLLILLVFQNKIELEGMQLTSQYMTDIKNDSQNEK
jgi:hypothetical protein